MTELKKGIFPPKFEVNQPVAFKIIRWLVTDNSNERPTAAELLTSNLIPLTLVTQYTYHINTHTHCV